MWRASLVRQFSQWLPRGSVAPAKGIALALCGVAAGALVRFLLTPLLPVGLPYITFMPVLLVVSVYAGVWPAILALVLATLVGSWLWVAPAGVLKLDQTGTVSIVAVLTIGLVVIGIARFFVLVLDQLRRSEERATMLAQEMRHRVGNLLSLVQSIARQSGRHSRDMQSFLQQFDTRLAAIARAQELVMPGIDAPTSLLRLVEAAIEPFGPVRFRLAGADLAIPATLTTGLSLIFNELCTNSMKYGALSAEHGHVTIRWRDLPDRIELSWKEENGPPVVAPERTGFGTVLTRSVLPPGEASCEITYEPDGLRSVIMIVTEVAEAA